jgi:hypothetical protein
LRVGARELELPFVAGVQRIHHAEILLRLRPPRVTADVSSLRKDKNMTNMEMRELRGGELDAVAAGANPLQALGQIGLVNVGAQIADLLDVGSVEVSILDNNQVLIRNVANGNTIQVGAGAVIAILGGAAGGLVRQLA